jgi:hypothetical protein
MATLEQKQELVETIKGKRYYRIQIYGYGGEHAYGTLTKEAHDFWKKVVEDHGDGDLCNYLLNAQDGEFEFDDIDSVPPEADFLMSSDADGEEWRSSWYEMPSEFEHVNSVSIDSGNINVDEVDGDDYNASHINEVIANKDINELASDISEETDWETEILDPIEDLYPDKGTYIIQMLSMEKGTFFDATVETVGDFDPKKLKISYSEAPNGEDVIHTVSYNNEELDNVGGDTNGKGYSAAVWQQ